MNTAAPLLDHVLDRLRELSRNASDPQAARDCARALRAARPDAGVEIVWEHGHDQRLHFDALVPVQGGVACLSYEPATSTPMALHGAMRWRESELLCVDGRRLLVHEAMTLLDAIWDEARMLERLVDACILDRLLEREPWEVSDEELQRAVDSFRSRHGLTDAQATERWLAARGLVLADLETSLERDLATAQLRRRLVADEASARFAADPSAFDRVDLAYFSVADEATARDCVAAIQAGRTWYDVAATTLLRQANNRGLRFDRVFRGTLRVDDDAVLREGGIVAAQRADGAPIVAQVHGITPGVWDAATRDELERSCFARWLADARARADIRWNWGH